MGLSEASILMKKTLKQVQIVIYIINKICPVYALILILTSEPF
jgi:hypothetical protein